MLTLVRNSHFITVIFGSIAGLLLLFRGIYISGSQSEGQDPTGATYQLSRLSDPYITIPTSSKIKILK